jgi:uncharacterized protein
MNNKTVHTVAFILLVVGGLNWLLVGVVGMNLVEAVLGGMPMAVKAVYILVGLSALYEVLTHKQNCTSCSTT